jgi:hypothetical protein
MSSPNEEMPNEEINGQRELLKLTRLAHNRLCADCKVPLGDGRILASLSFQVFICPACSEQHTLILGDIARIKVATGDSTIQWSKEDVKILQDAGSNVVVNNTLERFVPHDWKRLSPLSSAEERKQWVVAKYDVLYFCFPDGINYTSLQQHQQHAWKIAPKKRKKEKNHDEAVLPIRIADYFVTVGPGKCKQYGEDFRFRGSKSKKVMIHLKS